MKNKITLSKFRRPDVNLVDIELSQLIKLGFKQRVKGTVESGNLLCAANSEKDLWIELDGTESIDSKNFIVYFK